MIKKVFVLFMVCGLCLCLIGCNEMRKVKAFSDDIAIGVGKTLDVSDQLVSNGGMTVDGRKNVARVLDKITAYNAQLNSILTTSTSLDWPTIASVKALVKQITASLAELNDSSLLGFKSESAKTAFNTAITLANVAANGILEIVNSAKGAQK